MWIPKSKAGCQILLQQDTVSVAPCELLQCTAEPLHHPTKKKKKQKQKQNSGYASGSRLRETSTKSLLKSETVIHEHKQN